MVGHPVEYPWSSYRCNALGEQCELIKPHPLYQQLGRENSERTRTYRALFEQLVTEKTLDEIREATNKAWVLGSDYFKERIEKQINRPVAPRKRGGDRKSRKYNNINRV